MWLVEMCGKGQAEGVCGKTVVLPVVGGVVRGMKWLFYP